MSEKLEPGTIPAARISPLRKISGLWVIPILTLIVAGVMVYDYYRSQGPLITISFATAAGLEAGVTKVKIRDVEIGEVEDITLNSTLDRVIVSARIHNEFRSLMVEDSRFWVVQPTISLSGISGLSTLISGQYIRFNKGTSTRVTDAFFGLDQPPLTPLGTPGLHLTLITDGDFSFSKGDLIHHQGINVGKIEDVRFDLAASKTYYDAFIEAPFHELITPDTRFWKTSGVRAELTTQGFQVETDTIDSILLGGISFTTPAGQLATNSTEIQSEYYVYPNRNKIYEKQYQYSVQYWIMVSESISGLAVNSRVVYRGIDVGRVLRTDYIPEGRNLLDRSLDLPILIEINPGRLGLPDTAESLARTTTDLNSWIQQGLSATIKSQNFLLGQQLVELEYASEYNFSQLSYFNDIPIIPTNRDNIEKFTSSIEDLIAKFNGLPLEDMLDNVSKVAGDASVTLDEIRDLVRSGNELVKNDRNAALVEQLNATLAEFETLAASFSSESDANLEVQNTLKAIADLMNEFKPLIIEVRNKPNSLVFPSQLPTELEPLRKQP